MSFVLPNPSTADRAPRTYAHPVPSSSAAPVASTSAAPMSSGAIGSDTRRPPTGRPVTRRKGKGKGRTMMIKIFYALNSPRFGSSSSLSTTPHQVLPASTPTPDFLAVLDPSLAPSPNPPAHNSSQSDGAANYSCMARLSAPVWVQVLSARRSADGNEVSQFGRVTLKTCLSAICISRPELVIDSNKDFSVAAVDPYESSHQRQAPGGSVASTTSSRPGEGLVEGKGMLSWTLAEKKEGTTMVCGKIVGPAGGDARRSKRRRMDDGSTLGGLLDDAEDDDSEGDEPEETLEVWLQLTERDAFTQGQFLDCLRSYHNPVQQLQNEMSEFNSSPPKRRESAVFAPTTTAPAPRQSTSSSGDPVKRKRPREQPSLPLPSAPPPSTSLSAPFATGPAESSPAAFPAAHPHEAPLGAAASDLQDPRSAAMLNQLLASLASGGAAVEGPAPLLPQSLPLDSPQLLPALQTLAKYYGLELPGQPPASQSTNMHTAVGPSAAGAIFGAGQHASSSAQPTAPISTAASVSGSTTRRRPAKDREHFAAIDLGTLSAPPVGKQNPRDPSGCANCKRKKSTTWREGANVEGKLMSVCNACGIFFNKNGYHRSKTGPNGAPAATSPPQSSAAAANLSTAKGARPLQGRLTATCEADLKRKAKKQKAPAAAQPGLIPPLSPSKHVGPRSPAIKFDFGVPRSGGRSAGVAMSSPGRSPRMRYRSVAHPYAATSPLRGSTSSARPTAGADYESDGEERGPNPLSLGSLFGLNGSPSPVRLEQRLPSGGKGMPSYLMTASPGTALDRILNETNIGSIGGIVHHGGAADAMQLEQGGAGANDGLGDDFSFFLQPGSPTRNKENARPRGATSTDAPTTDFESFESVLSSLRRDFNARLSSNALTAPSSPAPSSPCVLPRTSTATPGSKGKAPQSGGRDPPSILDSFMDSLVPGLVLNAEAGSSAPQRTGLTPASDSDAWSPDRATQQDQDQTLTLDSLTGGEAAAQQRPSRSSRSSQQDSARVPQSKNVNRRAPFIPAHLLAPSDATDFDLGSLPPSSPPQLPSEAFPTPSDFDGITPSADGGDNDEQRAHHGGEPLTIEAVAQQVAREPDVDARKGMIALLQSLGGAAGGSEHVQLPGATAGDAVQLDRDTVNKLLALISANSRADTTDDVSPTPANEPAKSAATTKATETPAVAREQPHAPDLSDFDFSAFDAASATSAAAQSFGAGGQMSELYQDLFAGAPTF